MKITILFIILFFSIGAIAQTVECATGTFIKTVKTNPPTFGGFVLPPGPPELPPPTLPPPPPTLNDRAIFWVHGLGGSQNSWAEAATSTAVINHAPGFPARRAYCNSLAEYISSTLEASGHDLINDIADIHTGLPNDDYNFIIGHSQGGLVARAADEEVFNPLNNEPRRFYGIVTFGTPHLGAKILNSHFDGGLIQEFASDACQHVLQTEAFAFLEQKPILNFFISPGTIYNTVASICDAGSNVLPVALGDFLTGTTQDYKVGATKITAMNAFDNPDLKKTAFVGIEYKLGVDNNTANPKQLVWRTMSSFKDDATGPFSRDNDDKYVTAANKLIAEYYSKYQYEDGFVYYYEEIIGLPCHWWNYAYPLNLHPNAIDCANEPKYYIHLHARDAYRDAYLWFEHADADWKLIIGAKDFVLAPGECQCTHLPPDEFSETIGNIGSASACATFASTHSDEFEYCDWVAYLTETYHESDGIVPIESQKGYPNVASNVRMEETNHLQMTNCTATKLALLNLCNSGAGEPWFITYEK